MPAQPICPYRFRRHHRSSCRHNIQLVAGRSVGHTAAAHTAVGHTVVVGSTSADLAVVGNTLLVVVPIGLVVEVSRIVAVRED